MVVVGLYTAEILKTLKTKGKVALRALRGASGLTYCYNVNKVVFSKSVQDGFDGMFGDGEPEPLHAATDVHHDHQVFGGSGCLDVPGKDIFIALHLHLTDRQGSGLILLFVPFPSSAFADFSSSLASMGFPAHQLQLASFRTQTLLFFLSLSSKIFAGLMKKSFNSLFPLVV